MWIVDLKSSKGQNDISVFLCNLQYINHSANSATMLMCKFRIPTYTLREIRVEHNINRCILQQNLRWSAIMQTRSLKGGNLQKFCKSPLALCPVILNAFVLTYTVNLEGGNFCSFCSNSLTSQRYRNYYFLFSLFYFVFDFFKIFLIYFFLFVSFGKVYKIVPIQPTTAQRYRSETEKSILLVLFSSVLSQFQKYHPFKTWNLTI